MKKPKLQTDIYGFVYKPEYARAKNAGTVYFRQRPLCEKFIPVQCRIIGLSGAYPRQVLPRIFPVFQSGPCEDRYQHITNQDRDKF